MFKFLESAKFKSLNFLLKLTENMYKVVLRDDGWWEPKPEQQLTEYGIQFYEARGILKEKLLPLTQRRFRSPHTVYNALRRIVAPLPFMYSPYVDRDGNIQIKIHGTPFGAYIGYVMHE